MFLHKLEAKQETERLIASKNKKLQDLRKRWELFYFFIEMVTDGNMRSFGPEKNSQHAFYGGAIFLSSV